MKILRDPVRRKQLLFDALCLLAAAALAVAANLYLAANIGRLLPPH